MPEFLKPFFDGSYEPHGYCLLWQPGLIWTHVASDLLIAAAYFSIPIVLVSLVRQRKDLEFSGMFWLFALFIVACGSTHLLNVWNLWHGDYGLEAVAKIVTAVASVPTAVMLWPLLPKVLALPSPSMLRTANVELGAMVAERDRALEQVHAEILQRQQAEDALLQAKKIEALGQLTGGIAHDFNNLLQAIGGNLELIASRPGDQAKVERWAGNARQAVQRGSRLTGQLLTFSRSQRLETRVVDPGRLIEDMADLLRNSVGPTMRLEIAATPGDCAVKTDSNQLELAVLNLAINARDAMPDGGTINVAVEQVGHDAVISVTDHGVGMTPEVAERALEPFFTTKEPGRGTGLGLSMAFGVARAAGGTLDIDSTPGKGTTISMRMPLVDRADDSGRRSQPNGKLRRAMASLHILLCDDDEVVRDAVGDTLTEAGHSLVVARSAEEALKEFGKANFDICLLDFAMPGMTGAEVARHIRQSRPDMPILFLSGYSDSSAIDEAVQGTATVLSKPISADSLLRAIAEVAAPERTPISARRRTGGAA